MAVSAQGQCFTGQVRVTILVPGGPNVASSSLNGLGPPSLALRGPHPSAPRTAPCGVGSLGRQKAHQTNRGPSPRPHPPGKGGSGGKLEGSPSRPTASTHTLAGGCGRGSSWRVRPLLAPGLHLPLHLSLSWLYSVREGDVAPWGGGSSVSNTPQASTPVGLAVSPPPTPRVWITTPWSGQSSCTGGQSCLLSALTSTWKPSPRLCPTHPIHHLLAVLSGFSLLLGGSRR